MAKSSATGRIVAGVHTHQPMLATPIPARGAVVAGPLRNEAAHGGVTMIEACDCGLVRLVNANGPHREIGGWTLPA